MAGRIEKLRNIFNDIFGNISSARDMEGVGYKTGDLIGDLDSVGSGLSTGTPDFMDISNDSPAREVDGILNDVSNLSRRQRYISYDTLEEIVPEVEAALNLYADEASSYNADYHTIEIRCSNSAVVEELEFLFFKLIKIDDKSYAWCRNLAKYGDWFGEIVIDPNAPHVGILKVNELDPYSMWRIQTRRGKLLEFQQTKMMPDYDVVYQDIMEMRKRGGNQELDKKIMWQKRMSSTQRPGLIRFAPAQVVHMALGGEKKNYAPYGYSMIASARRPAYNLRLMEDSMLLYRLIRAPEKRAYYVDLGQLPSNKSKAFMEDFKKSVKRKKIVDEKTGQVDERYNPMTVDDDIFIPIRPGSQTRIDPLPGAQNLGEIDDAIYFRKKLYLSLGIPPGYLEQTIESQNNRLTLSQQAMVFAKKVYRIQRVFAQGLVEIAERHLALIGVPENVYENLEIIVTPSSEWRELAQSEVLNSRAALAQQYASIGIVSNDWVRKNIMRLSDDESEEEKNKISTQEIMMAELEAQKTLVAARAQVEIDRANALIQAEQGTGEGEDGFNNQEFDTEKDSERPESGDEETEEDIEIPSEEEILSSIPEDDDIKKDPPARGRIYIDQADMEIERDGY
jgi:hypothetical protein